MHTYAVVRSFAVAAWPTDDRPFRSSVAAAVLCCAVLCRHDTDTLSDLNLFDGPLSSAMTFLRIFTARSFMLDLDKLYHDRPVCVHA